MSTNESQGNADYTKVNASTWKTATKQKTERLYAPVFSLFLRTSIILIISLLINGLYSFVDAIFISRAVGTAAIGFVSTLLNAN